jgi:hypothetical protein
MQQTIDTLQQAIAQNFNALQGPGVVPWYLGGTRAPGAPRRPPRARASRPVRSALDQLYAAGTGVLSKAMMSMRFEPDLAGKGRLKAKNPLVDYWATQVLGLPNWWKKYAECPAMNERYRDSRLWDPDWQGQKAWNDTYVVFREFYPRIIAMKLASLFSEFPRGYIPIIDDGSGSSAGAGSSSSSSS